MRTKNLLRPIPHYYETVSHYTCPKCNERLTGYNDITEYKTGNRNRDKTTRTFYPCECVDGIDYEN